MNKTELEERTRRFALAVVRFVSSLPKGKVPDVLGRQLLVVLSHRTRRTGRMRTPPSVATVK